MFTRKLFPAELVFKVGALALLLLLDGSFARHSEAQGNKMFSCGDKLPQFTLGVQTRLTDRQLETLCTCVSNNLENKAKETGIELATAEKTNRKFDDAGIQRIKEFSYAFGNAIKKCGGDKL